MAKTVLRDHRALGQCFPIYHVQMEAERVLSNVKMKILFEQLGEEWDSALLAHSCMYKGTWSTDLTVRMG